MASNWGLLHGVSLPSTTSTSTMASGQSTPTSICAHGAIAGAPVSYTSLTYFHLQQLEGGRFCPWNNTRRILSGHFQSLPPRTGRSEWVEKGRYRSEIQWWLWGSAFLSHCEDLFRAQKKRMTWKQFQGLCLPAHPLDWGQGQKGRWEKRGFFPASAVLCPWRLIHIFPVHVSISSKGRKKIKAFFF